MASNQAAENFISAVLIDANYSLLIGNPLLKEASLEIKEVTKKTKIHSQVNQDVPSKVVVVYHTSNEHASLCVNEKERSVKEISEGCEKVFVDTIKIGNGIKPRGYYERSLTLF